MRYAASEVDLTAVTSPPRRPVRYRVYCFACGRSSEVDTAPRRMKRCEACGGTMLVEMGDSDY
jgi:rRNA maturation endonuclease Nob1